MSEKKSIKPKFVTDYTPKKGNEWHLRFLEMFYQTGNVTLSCSAVKMTKTQVYRHRKKYKAFANAWSDAKDAALDFLEYEARKRAMKMSDTLLIFLLKAHRPEIYHRELQLKRELAKLELDKIQAQKEINIDTDEVVIK